MSVEFIARTRPLKDALARLSDNLLEVVGAKNIATGAYLNAATVTAILVNADTGAQIAGQTWPLALAYVASSNGDYRGTVNDDITVTTGQRVIAQITFNGGAGLQRYTELPLPVVVDRG